MAREVAIHCSIYIQIAENKKIEDIEKWAHEQLLTLCNEQETWDYQLYDAEEREV